MSEWFDRFGFAEVGDGLLTGAYPTDETDVAALVDAGVQEIVNLCQDIEYEEGARAAVGEALDAAGIAERRVQLVDYGIMPAPVLEEAVSTVLEPLDAGRRVYLHCRAGWQRSAAVAAGVIALREHLDIAEALAQLRARRATSAPLDHQRDDLLAWWAARGE
jgi:protein-tyrosine phosphatase